MWGTDEAVKERESEIEKRSGERSGIPDRKFDVQMSYVRGGSERMRDENG